MSPEALQKLSGIRHPWQVKEALSELCRPYGEIVGIEVVRDGDDAAICIVNLATVGQNAALCREFGGFSYGTGVCFRIQVKHDE